MLDSKDKSTVRILINDALKTYRKEIDNLKKEIKKLKGE